MSAPYTLADLDRLAFEARANDGAGLVPGGLVPMGMRDICAATLHRTPVGVDVLIYRRLLARDVPASVLPMGNATRLFPSDRLFLVVTS